MAGDWIKIRTGLSKEPEVIAIAADLCVCEHTVVGWLVELWGWADAHLDPDLSRSCHASSVTSVTQDVTQDVTRSERSCHAPRVSSGFVDRLVGKNGFAKALESVGWLEVGEGGISFPRFGRHNSKTAKQRALASRRKQSERVGASRKRHDDVTQDVTLLSRSHRDISVTREEKRREDGGRGRKDGEAIRIASLAKTAEIAVSADRDPSDSSDPPDELGADRDERPKAVEVAGEPREPKPPESTQGDCGQFAWQESSRTDKSPENRSQGGSRPRSERMISATEWSEWVSVWNGAAAPVGVSSVQHRQTKLSENTRRRIRAYEPDETKRKDLLHEIAAELERSAQGIANVGGGGWFSLHWLFERQGANCEKFLSGQYRRGNSEEAASAARQREALDYVRRAEQEEQCRKRQTASVSHE